MLALARVHLLVPRTSRPFCLVLAPITSNKKQIFQFQFHNRFLDVERGLQANPQLLDDNPLGKPKGRAVARATSGDGLGQSGP